jgi:hypothetical protein
VSIFLGQIIKQLSEEPNTSAAGLWAHSDDIGMLDAIGHMLEQELEGVDAVTINGCRIERFPVGKL